MILIWLFLLASMPAGKAFGIITKDTITIAADSSKIFEKTVSTTIFDEFHNDKNFIYERPQPELNNFWKKILNKIGRIFQFGFENKAVHILILVIFGGVFIFLIYLLLGGNFQTLFSKNKSISGDVINYTEEHIDIIDFDTLISSEINKGNLNLAVRYSFLKLLQALSHQNLIQWQKDKTNREYMLELSNQSFIGDFKRLTYAYEYIWYGKFPINRDTFGEIRTNINGLIDQIHG